jgi:hypothetical protein
MWRRLQFFRLPKGSGAPYFFTSKTFGGELLQSGLVVDHRANVENLIVTCRAKNDRLKRERSYARSLSLSLSLSYFFFTSFVACCYT